MIMRKLHSFRLNVQTGCLHAAQIQRKPRQLLLGEKGHLVVISSFLLPDGVRETGRRKFWSTPYWLWLHLSAMESRSKAQC